MKNSENLAESSEQADSTKPGDDGRDELAFLVLEILRTRELRELLGTIAPELVKVWAGRSMLKRMVASPVGNIIGKGMTKEKELQAAKGFSALFEDPAFMASLSDQLPTLVNGLIDAVGSVGRYTEKLPVEEKERCLTNLISGIDIGRTGELLTAYARTINQVYQQNPRLLTETFMPGIRDWIERLDFGELRETLELSTDDLNELITKFWEAMCRYPAKVVTLMSALPNTANILIHLIKETLGQISRLFQSPDMITDFFLTVLRRIDGKSVGELVNVLTEIVRQLHTGSALLGEPGSPLFPRDISELLNRVVDTVDPELFNKARRGMAEGRETIEQAVIDVLRRNPELLIGYLKTSHDLRNLRIKALSRKISLVEDLPEEDTAGVIARSVTDLNTHDLAEMVNSLNRTLNRIRRTQPEFSASVMEEFVNGVDLDELRETIKWIAEDLGKAIRPIGRVIAPQLVKMICEWATPEDDAAAQDITEAVNSLQNLLQGREVSP